MSDNPNLNDVNARIAHMEKLRHQSEKIMTEWVNMPHDHPRKELIKFFLLASQQCDILRNDISKINPFSAALPMEIDIQRVEKSIETLRLHILRVEQEIQVLTLKGG